MTRRRTHIHALRRPRLALGLEIFRARTLDVKDEDGIGPWAVERWGVWLYTVLPGLGRLALVRHYLGGS